MRKSGLSVSVLFTLVGVVVSFVSQAQWTTTTLSQERSNLSSASLGTKVFFAGGGSYTAYSNSVDIYDNSANTWTTAILSQARHALSAAAAGTKVVFAGGYNDNASATVDIYDMNTNTWTTATLSQARYDLSSTSVGTKIFFAGGVTTLGVSNVVDIYDTSTNTWTTAALSEARFGLSATTVGTKVFFAGGFVGTTPSATVDIFDTNTGNWTTAALSQARLYLSAASIGTKVFFAGGGRGDGIPYSSVVDIYDNSTNTWTTASLSDGKFGLSATSVDSKVFFAGGIGTNSIESNIIDVYDNSTNMWTTEVLSQGRYFLTAASIGTKALFAGGYTVGGFYSNVVDIYDVNGPTISSFNPVSVAQGSTVTITGTNFTGATAVKFGGVAATSFNVVSATSITAVVAQGSSSGSVSITTAGGTASKTGFTFISPPPTITSFSPTSGPIGTNVNITGMNFSSNVSNNTVYFGATRATVTAATTTQLTVKVPSGATYQPISVLSNGLTAYSNAPFVVTFAGTGQLDINSFATKADFSTGDMPRCVAIGDLDLDGKPDLVIANGAFGPTNPSTISILRNTSVTGSMNASSFSAKVDLATGNGPLFVTIGDLDGDGKPDIIVTNTEESSVGIFRNTTSSGEFTINSFASRVDFTTGSSPRHLAIGDLDADGKPEMAVVNQNSNSISIYKNTTAVGEITTSSFAPNVDFLVGTTPTSVAMGDLDADGKPDLAVANSFSNSISVFKNITSAGVIGVSSFAPKVDFTTGSFPWSIAVGDLNNNGKPELAVATTGSTSVSVFNNISTAGTLSVSSFAGKVDFSTGTGPEFLAIADINGDSKPDLTVTNTASNSLSLFKNQSATELITVNSFGNRVDVATGMVPRSNSIADLDGDGKPDLVVCNNGSNTVSVLRNIIGEPSTPAIISFSPGSAAIGASVTITGTNFTGATSVSFGGTAAASFTVVSATSIVAVISSGTSGNVSVTTPGGTAAKTGFTFNPAPTISSFNPASAGAGATVTLTGTNFTGATSVSFGGTAAASFTVFSSTRIVAVISSGTSGNVSVTTPGGTAAKSGFTFNSAPTISSFNPASAGAGATVTLTGTNFAGATSVSFGGTVATTFIVNSATSIAAIVSSGTSGSVSVTTPGGTVISPGFTFIPAPTITTFTPTTGTTGTTVTINGTNFSTVAANNTVKFNGVLATIIGNPTSTSITTSVPMGATTGKITVAVDGQTATSATNFNLGIASRLGRFVVNKTSGCAPLTVTITDTNLLTSSECTAGKPCIMNFIGTDQQNTFSYTYLAGGVYKLSVLYQSIGADDITITVNEPSITLSPSATICAGTFTSLNASGANSYTWSPATTLSAASGSTVIASPNTTTTYTVTGTDAGGCSKTSSTTVTVNTSCAIPNLASGNGLDAYRIFSIPLKLSDKRIETVLASAIQKYGGYDQEKWRLVHYSNGENLNYTQGLSTIEHGKGYWLLSVDPLSINITGLPAGAVSDQSINLDKGWNQIGNPFAFDVSWNDVLARSNNSNVGKLYVYDPTTVSFKESDNLKAWGGGFVNTTSATSLQIPVTVKQATGGRTSTNKEMENNMIDQPSWFVPLRLQHAAGINDLGGIGMHTEARVGRDQYDENSLPRFVKYLELNSYHDEYFQPRFMRDIVPSTSNYNWNLMVESNFGEEDVTLTWDYDVLNKNYGQLFLYDKESNVLVDMKKAGAYRFRLNGSRTFTVMYAVDQNHLSVMSVMFGNPYPNPIDEQTRIPFIASENDGIVSIGVYDLMGRKIKDLGNSKFEKGYHEVTWNRDNYMGEHVSAGIYIIRASSSNSSVVSTRVMVK